MHDAVTWTPALFAAIEATVRAMRTPRGTADLSEIPGAAYDAGRTSGWYAGRLDLAARKTEAQDAWKPAGRNRQERRVQDRLADFERCAADVAARLGRRPGYRYRGGPVDWETGLPAGSACAWLRATKSAAPRVGSVRRAA